MNFIKSNLIFMIVMSLTFLGSIYLIYLDISKHSLITEAQQTAKQSKDESKKLLDDKKTTPADLNVKWIQNDTLILRRKVKQLQRIFGNPYRNAMHKFAQAVGVTEDDLRSKLRGVCEEENNKGKTSEVLVPILLDRVAKEKKITPEKMKDLFRISFINEAQKRTVEDLDFVSGHVLLGLSLGLDRQMTPTMASVHLGVMQGKMHRQDLIPGVKTLEGVQNFTFNQFVQRPPSGADVEDILVMLPIFEDIFRFRMKESGLTSVSDFRRVGLPATVSEVYKEYKFETTIHGSINSVRKFAHLLQKAYEDNHVYVINWVSVVAGDSIKEVQDLRTRLTTPEKNDENDQNNRVGNRRRNRNPRRRAVRNRAAASRNMVRLDPSDKNYGKVLIGKDKNVQAVIKFSYFVYIGEKINRNQN